MLEACFGKLGDLKEPRPRVGFGSLIVVVGARQARTTAAVRFQPAGPPRDRGPAAIGTSTLGRDFGG